MAKREADDSDADDAAVTSKPRSPTPDGDAPISKRRNIRIPASASRSKASQPVVTAVPQLQIQIGGGQQEWQWGGLRPLDHAPAFQRSSMLAAGSSASPPSAVQRSYTEKRVQFSKFPYARAADRKLRKPGDQKCTRGPAVPACFGRIVRQSPTKVKSARPGSTITVRQRHPRSDLQAVIRGLRLALGIKNKCPYPLLPAPVLLELVSKLAKCSIADNSWDVAVPEFDDMAVDFEGSLDDVVTSEFAYEEADIWMAMDYARNTGGDASEKGNTLLDVGKKTFQWIGKLWNRETDRASTDVRDSEEPESVDHWARVTDAERANWTELDTSGTGLRCEEMRGGDSGMSFADVTMTSDTFGTPLNSPSSHAEAEQDEKGQLKGILSPSRVQSYGSPDKNRVRFNKTPYIRVIPNKADANRSWNFRDLAKPECSPFRLPRVSTDSDTSDSSSPFFQPRQLHFPSSDDSPVITPQKTPGADTRPSTLDLLSPRTEAAHVLLSMQGGSSGTPNNTATEEFARPARPATPGPLGLRFSAGLGKSPRLPTVLGGKKAGVENGLPMVSALVNELQSVEEKDEEKLENGKTNRPWRYRPAGYVRPQDRPKPVDHGPRPLNPEYFPRFCKPFVYVEPEKKDTVVYSYPLRDSGCSLETLLGYCKNSNNALIEAMRAQQQEEEEQLEQEEEFIEDDSMGESTGVESGLAEVPRDDRSLDEDDEIAGELVEPTDEEKSGNNATIAMEELEAAELLNESAQPDLQQSADATDAAPEDEAMEEELGNVEVIETDEVLLEERDDDEESEKMSVESVSTAGGDVPTEGYYVIEDEETTGSEGSTVGRKDEGVVSVTLVEEVTEIFAHQDDSESDSDSSDDNAVEYSDKSDSESSEEDDNGSVVIEDDAAASGTTLSQAPAAPATPLGVRLRDVEEGPVFRFSTPLYAGELIGAPVDFSQTPKSGVDFGPHVFGSPDPDLAILRSCPDLIELDNTVIQDKPTLAEMLNAGNDVEESPLDTTEIISDVPVEITTEDSPLDTTEIITDTPEEIMADDPSQDTPEIVSETPEEMTTTEEDVSHSEAEVGDSRPESVVDAAMDATLVSEETQASEPGSLAPSDAGSLMMGASGSEASLSRSQSEEIGLPSIPEAVEEEKDMFEDTQPQTASSSSSPKPVPIPRSHSGSKVKGKRQPAQLISLSQPVGPAATAHAEAEVKQRRRGRTASVAKKPEEEPPAQRRAPPRRAKQAAVEKMHVANIRTKRGQSVDSAGTSQPKISRAASHK